MCDHVLDYDLGTAFRLTLVLIEKMNIIKNSYSNEYKYPTVIKWVQVKCISFLLFSLSAL